MYVCVHAHIDQMDSILGRRPHMSADNQKSVRWSPALNL
jgi:hypothetical protein